MKNDFVIGHISTTAGAPTAFGSLALGGYKSLLEHKADEFNTEKFSYYLFQNRQKLHQAEGDSPAIDPVSYLLDFLDRYPRFNKKAKKKVEKEKGIFIGLFYAVLGLMHDASPKKIPAPQLRRDLEPFRKKLISRAQEINPVHFSRAIQDILDYLNDADKRTNNYRTKILETSAKIDFRALTSFLENIVENLDRVAVERHRQPSSSQVPPETAVPPLAASPSKLSLYDLPFQQVAFHKFTATKAREICCKVFDASDVGREEAAGLMSQLVGTEQVTRHLAGLQQVGHTSLFRQAVSMAVKRMDPSAVVHATPARNNMVLEGPTGVGKTLTAQGLGVSLIADKLVPIPKIFMVTALSLRGEYQGETDKIVQKLFEFCRGGILIIDEFDKLGTTNFDNEVRHEINVNMEDLNKAGTVAIATSYLGGMQEQFTHQPGLIERFPHIISIPAYDDAQIGRVLKLKLELEKLGFADGVEDLVVKELVSARAMLGDKFGNGRTVEGFVTKMIEHHAARHSEEVIRNVLAGGQEPASFLAVDTASVPRFDQKTKRFVERRGNLTLIMGGRSDPGLIS